MTRCVRVAVTSLCVLCGGCATWSSIPEEDPVAPAAPRRPVTAKPLERRPVVAVKPVERRPAAVSKPYVPHPPPPSIVPSSSKHLPARAAPIPAIEPRPELGLSAVAAHAAPTYRTILAVQTFLDRQNYSCNCIDGKVGTRTKQAVRAWQGENGQDQTGELTPELLAQVGAAEQYFTMHTVSADEASALTEVPETWAARAASTRLGFRTILETLAEKYHVSEGTLRALNPDVSWPNPPEGTRITAPNPLPAAVVRAARATIRLGVKTVFLHDAEDRLIAVFPCSIAAKVEKRPVGDLKIVKAAADPEYLFDPALFREDPEAQTIAGKRMIAAGPNNPVGVAWVSLDRPGYGIHGTPHPEDIGKTESHGCFRLANWNARRFLNMVSVGMPVRVEP